MTARRQPDVCSGAYEVTALRCKGIRYVFVLILCAGGAASLAVEKPVNPQVPACEPRSQREPGRLNISVEAEGFGLTPACHSELVFYIARNTKLRSLSGELALTTAAGRVLARDDFVAKLSGPTGGLWRSSVTVPAGDSSCASLDLMVEVQACRDASGEDLICPAIRVRPNHVFRELFVRGNGLEPCMD